MTLMCKSFSIRADMNFMAMLYNKVDKINFLLGVDERNVRNWVTHTKSRSFLVITVL